MIDLDKVSEYASIDASDYLGVIESFPAQVREAMQIAQAADRLPDASGVNSIAVLGMGGSGISGNVLELALASTSDLFVRTLKGYELPGWVGPNTLVFATSYSGNTEETLATYEQAEKRGARIVVVSTGGAISQSARSAGYPVVEIPAGLQPRAALGYLAVPLLVLSERMGLVTGLSADLAETMDLLDARVHEYSRDADSAVNPAKRLANELFGRIPVVYGSEGLAEVAAYRWKCQFNECSKIPSYSHVFPELNHNEIVGWNQLDDLTRSALALVVLRHDGEHERVSRRIDITLPLIGENLGLVQEVVASGESTLARFFDLVYFGDFASTYLAIAQGVDPAPVVVIESLKKQLAK